ncbi:GxxExxY protein [Flavobacterium pectinovorum]|uniref:GxxExxY protein n=1 Tax=Flavobacterium pectinovorum TaxID=29533 RepID=A0AB36P062_9FLAO|nr:GxxExxY protein [Flavobacterium pectinovorum]OXB04227.1 GxxExxY protein [Flavobacterium pectinovorum]SHL49934.1 GxxExxY protein [Flavobacterium pectinovorum]
MKLLHEELTDVIIKTFYEVYNELGYGFLERVYQNSLYLELKSKGLKVEAQKKIEVYYKGIEVGQYYADLIVEDLIILELKAADGIVKEFENQILNYLKGTNCEVGLLLNFGTKPEFKRKIFENNRKLRIEKSV